MARHPFPIPPAELIERAREVLAAGVHRWPDLAQDFEFTGACVCVCGGGGGGGGEGAHVGIVADGVVKVVCKWVRLRLRLLVRLLALQ